MRNIGDQIMLLSIKHLLTKQILETVFNEARQEGLRLHLLVQSQQWKHYLKPIVIITNKFTDSVCSICKNFGICVNVPLFMFTFTFTC